MIWLLIVFLVILGSFSFVLIIGAPFLPTLNNQISDIFELLDLKPGDLLLELGSGDGRILRAAAQRGIKTIGYEINPLLVLYGWLLSWRYHKLITIRWKNYWHAPIGSADAIYIFLLDPYMKKLDRKISREIKQPLKVVSFTFAFPDRKPVKKLKGLKLYLFKPLN
jgi:hypothetical protein